ncbi:hypothetical protein FMEXI_13993 [Fusarium mexicanum]|uniref:Uncharacterized protein n=1 Tax=Fusarium mexicanum TaxID=751941 RepID=A0A8H5I3I2_9HYPO|nr:hypothetical protein FMEXI_13993 [Fusarium mexicanum]
MDKINPVWESKVVELEALGREGTVYRLANYLNETKEGRDFEREVLKSFCWLGDNYIRLNKRLCSKIGFVGMEQELYLSLSFLDNFVDGDIGLYEWHKYRALKDLRNATICPVTSRTPDNYQIEWPIKVNDLEYPTWKKMLEDTQLDKQRKEAISGGYRIPVRRKNGKEELVELSSKFKGMVTVSLWLSVYREATSLWTFNAKGASFRGFDPDNLTVYILPLSEERAAGKGSKVTWGDVTKHFSVLPNNLKTKYKVVKSPKDVEALELSYISKDDMRVVGKASYRPLAPYTHKKHNELRDLMRPHQTDLAIRRTILRNGARIFGREGSIPLSTAAMLKAVGKRKETASQETVMGISAPEGGAFKNPTIPTVVKISIRQRYEAAWQTLFHLERQYRVACQNNNDPTGELWFWSHSPTKDEEKNWFDHCPWIHFHLDWALIMDDKSHLLDLDNPCAVTELLPFERECFTKGEAIVDVALLQTVYERRVARVKGLPKRGICNTFTNDMVPKANLQPLGMLELLRMDSQGGPENDIDLDDVRNIDELAEPLEMADQASGFIQEITLTEVESELTSADNINQLDSCEGFETHFTDFRNSLFEDSGVDVAQFETSVNSVEMKVSSSTSQAPLKISGATQTEDRVTVGGILLHNVRLVACNDQGKFADLPVTVRAVDTPATEAGILLVQAVTDDQVSVVQTSSPPPILLLSSSPRADIEIVGSTLSTVSCVAELATQTFSEVGTSPVSRYTMKSDVYDLFGIPGLAGELVSNQNSDPEQPIKETVKPDLAGFTHGPIARLFPSISSDIIKKLPIENVQFVYSEALDEFHNAAGLSMTADITFTGPLRPINDLLKYVYSGNPKNIPPSRLQVEARLGAERDWSSPIIFNNFAFRGSVDPELWIGDMIMFRKVGVEVSVMSLSSSATNKKDWKLGYELFGELDIHEIPGTTLYVTMRYRMRKVGSMYALRMNLTSNEWRSVFGIKNLNITDVECHTSVDIQKPSDSFTIGISATMKLGEADIFLAGQYSKFETYLEAEIGNMTWAEIVEAYTQITGNAVDNAANDHDLKFENIYVMLSKASFELKGKVSFNGQTSAGGCVKFDEDGLTIKGAIANFKIPDTEVLIEAAELDIFIGSQGSENLSERASKFSIKGEVEFQGIRIAAGLDTNTDGSPDSRRWILYGSYEGNLRLSQLEAAKELKNSPGLDIALKSVAVIASNRKGIWVNPLTKISYSLSDGLSLFALIDPLPAVNSLANNKNVDGLMLVASVNAKQFSVAIELPQSLSIKMGDIAEIERLALGLRVSSNPSLTLGCDIKINMNEQPPLILHANLAALLDRAEGQIYLDHGAPWKNPFGVSEKIVVEKLGGRIAFAYSTVFISGPSELGFTGAAKCGDFTGQATMIVSNNPARQVLKVDISNLNVAQLIRLAGDLADLDTLRNISCGDFLIFNQASMYFSTGIDDTFGESFPAGISAAGDVTVFGKRAIFKASLGSGGFELLGEVDPFKIGPLEVHSASGNPRAKLEIAMTSGKQLVEIDGVVVIGGEDGLQIGTLIKACVSPVMFDVWVFVRFSDQIKFDLQARAQNVSNFKELSEANVTFSLTLDVHLLELFCDEILKFLDELKNLATASTEALEWGLQKRLNDVSREVNVKKQKLDALEAKIWAERESRDRQRIESEKKMEEAQRELDKLQRAHSETIWEKEKAEQAIVDHLEQAKLDLAAAEQLKRLEWQSQLQSAQRNQERYSNEKSQLEGDKSLKYGDIMDTIASWKRVLGSVKLSLDEALENSNMKRKALPGMGWFERTAESAKIWALDFGITALKNRLREIEDSINRAETQLKSPAFRNIEFKIDMKVADYNKASNMLSSLLEQGVDAFVKAALEDEEAKVESRQRELNALLDDNSKYMTAIHEAKARLDARQPDLDRFIAEEDDKIHRAKESMAISELQEQLKSVKEDQERKQREREVIMAGASMIRERIDIGSDTARELVKGIKEVSLRVKGVSIIADGKELVQGGPMTFKVMVEYEGKIVTLEEKWAPLQKPALLYRDIMNSLLGV